MSAGVTFDFTGLQIAMLGGFLDRIGGASSHLAPADVA